MTWTVALTQKKLHVLYFGTTIFTIPKMNKTITVRYQFTSQQNILP